MSLGLVHHVRPVALELHGLLHDLDPSRWNGVDDDARQRIARIEKQLESVLEEPEPEPTLVERVSDIAELLREEVPAADLPVPERDDAWARFRKQLGLAYERLSVALKRWSVHVPSLRPTNYTRSSFHALTAVVVILLVEHVLTRRQIWIVPLCFASTFWFLEGMRKHSARARAFLLWLFRAIAHPHERYRINSSTWFATALFIIGFAYEPMICVVALAVIGFADPAAALVGRRWGKTRLINNRSLQGSLTFVVVGCLASLAVLAIWHAELSFGAMLLLSLGAAVPAALAELLSRRLDDNLTIPVVAATGAYLASLLL